MLRMEPRPQSHRRSREPPTITRRRPARATTLPPRSPRAATANGGKLRQCLHPCSWACPPPCRLPASHLVPVTPVATRLANALRRRSPVGMMTPPPSGCRSSRTIRRRPTSGTLGGERFASSPLFVVVVCSVLRNHKGTRLGRRRRPRPDSARPLHCHANVLSHDHSLGIGATWPLPVPAQPACWLRLVVYSSCMTPPARDPRVRPRSVRLMQELGVLPCLEVGGCRPRGNGLGGVSLPFLFAIASRRRG